VYEFSLDSGTLLNNITFYNYILNDYLVIVCFNNKLITTRTEENLLFLNYYNSKLEINFTESVKNIGIEFDQNKEIIMDIVEKNINETSTELLILTQQSRLFTININN
jgi:hypothetical protein